MAVIPGVEVSLCVSCELGWRQRAYSLRTQRSIQFHGEQSLLSEGLRQLLNLFSLLCFSSFTVKRLACCFLCTPAVSVSPCLRTNKCSELALRHRLTLEQLFLGVPASGANFFLVVPAGSMSIVANDKREELAHTLSFFTLFYSATTFIHVFTWKGRACKRHTERCQAKRPSYDLSKK